MPADKILDSLCSEKFKNVFFLSECRRLFLSGNGFSLSWRTAIKDNSGSSYLSKDCIEKLMSFSDLFGSSDKENELQNCDNYILYFEERQKEIHEKSKDKPRIYSTLGILAGVLAVIVLF